MQKKQCRRLIQIAYYQAGKIVVQTLLPQHPPVALIILNILGITSSTSADTHIPINNTQCCSSLETRLIGFYGGKAASLLFEYQVFYKRTKEGMQPRLRKPSAFAIITDSTKLFRSQIDSVTDLTSFYGTGQSMRTEGSNTSTTCTTEGGTGGRGGTGGTAGTEGTGMQPSLSYPEGVLDMQKSMDYKTRYFDKKMMRFDPHFAKIDFTGVGNNPFQSNIGNRENQAAHQLASTMVNYWNLYSINCVNKSFHLLEKDSFYPVNETGVAPCFIRNISIAAKKYSISRLLAMLLRNKTSISTSTGGTGGNGGFISYRRYTCAYPSIPVHTEGSTVANPERFRRKKSSTGLLPCYLRYAQVCWGMHGKQGQIKSKQRNNLAICQILKSFPSSEGTLGKGNKFIKNWNSLLPRKGSFLRFKDKIPQSKLLPILSVLLPLWGKCRRTKINFGMELRTPLSSIPPVLPEVVQAVLMREGTLKNLAQLALITKIDDKSLRFAIYQTKNSFQIGDTTDSYAAIGGSKFLYNTTRTSVKDIGEKKSLSTDAFQLINPLHFSNGQRDRFYPSWFRLYLPDIEATEFLKNVANYYFSLGLQTLTNPSSKELTRILYANITEHSLKFTARQALPSVYLHSSLYFLWNERKSILWLAKQSVPVLFPTELVKSKKSMRTCASSLRTQEIDSNAEVLSENAKDKQEPGKNKRQLENSLINFKEKKRKESGTINIRRAFQKESIDFVSQSSKFSSISINSLLSLNLKTCSFSLIQKMFFCCGDNNLSIGIGLLRSAAKRRNQLNIKNLSIDYVTFGPEGTTCFTPTVLIKNDYSYAYLRAFPQKEAQHGHPTVLPCEAQVCTGMEAKQEVQLKQKPISYPTVSMVFWGFLKPWKINRFVNIDFRQILACTTCTTEGGNSGTGILVHAYPEHAQVGTARGILPIPCVRREEAQVWKGSRVRDVVHFSGNAYASSYEIGKHWVGQAKKGIGSNTKIWLRSTKKNSVTREKRQCVQVPQRHNTDKFVVEKEFLFHALINNCFLKSFCLVNQNRQLIDYFVDYLIRFQILRQHQILYIFSTLLLTCKK